MRINKTGRYITKGIYIGYKMTKDGVEKWDIPKGTEFVVTDVHENGYCFKSETFGDWRNWDIKAARLDHDESFVDKALAILRGI